MNAKIKNVITAMLSAALLASCAIRPGVTGQTETPEVTEAQTETTAIETEVQTQPTQTSKNIPQFPEFNADYSTSDPSIGYKVRSLTFYRDGNPITARITYPEGSGPYKTIIMSNGLYAYFGRYAALAQRYTTYGYAVIEFQFQNGTAPSPYKDPKWLGDFIYEQVLDLYAVLDGAKELPDVDNDNIYLFGHSMGGLVTAYVGTMRQTELKGLILLDPSFYACKIMKFENEKTIRTDIYALISRCFIPVVIISGTKAFACEPRKTADQARVSLPYSEYYVIEGATHSFNGVYGDQVVDISSEVLKKWAEEGR
ncbi:MAG: alpha/beta hydrolase [Saccharofermentans sp.]|nr:alpha/beta hydrolase [Saccharofermentans sp.]